MCRILMMCVLQGCIAGEFHPGNGQSATEDRIVGGFTGVTAAMSIPVDVSLGSEPAVSVTCDENLLDLIETEVRKGDLVVRAAHHDHLWVVLDPTVDCRVQVTTLGVHRVTSTGSGLLSVTGGSLDELYFLTNTGSGGLAVHGKVAASEVDVTNTGSSTVLIDAIEAKSVHLGASGSGSIIALDGNASALRLTITGSGDIDAEGLVAEHVDATLTGSGSGVVTATRSLSATLTGSGDLYVQGDPKDRDAQSTGSGDVVFE